MDNELEERVNRVDDDESEYSSEEEVDEDVLQYEYHESPHHSFAAIKRNDPSVISVFLMPEHPYAPCPMTPDEWVALGQNIGRNTSLKSFHTDLHGREEDEISSAENLKAFCIGISHNRSIKQLKLHFYNMGRAGLENLHPFVIENDYLTDLRLHSCCLNFTDIQLLANAFARRRNPESIKHIDLSTNAISDESVQAIFELSNYCPWLKTLDLGFCSIGDGGCTHLASMLANPESRLKSLGLHGNPISDEGAQILANALTNNRRLTHLELNHYNGISSRGWNAFVRVLCDPSSISTTYHSNHTLQNLWDCIAPQSVPDELRLALQANAKEDKVIVACKKTINTHMDGNFDLSPFRDMDATVLLHALGRVGNEWANNIQCVLWIFYRIIRNRPGLCSFPSREKKLNQRLEEEISMLNRKVIDLEEKNEQLMRKIEILESNKRQKC